MANGKPTVAAMMMLEACINPIDPPKFQLIRVNCGSGFGAVTKAVFTKESRIFKYLVDMGFLMSVPVKARGLNYCKHRYVTSAKGVLLLHEWSKRKSFKPFFDAFCGHINELQFKRLRIVEMMDGPEKVLPPWIKGFKKLHPDNVEKVEYSDLPF